MKRPVRVGDVYQIGTIRFEVTAFDLSGAPVAIGVESSDGASKEARKTAAHLAQFWRLLSGGMGQAVDP